MSDIDKMPPICHDCPYWELAETPYLCFRCEEIMYQRAEEDIETTASGMSRHTSQKEEGQNG